MYKRQALTGLARNSGFVTRAMALEFGVSPEDTAEVYTPRTAAAARDEQAENPLAESTYVPSSDTENDNPVLSAADKAATVSILSLIHILTSRASTFIMS